MNVSLPAPIESAPTSRRRQHGRLWMPLVLGAVAFGADLATPVGAADGLLYVVAVLATLRARSPRVAWWSAAVLTSVMVLGYILSPDSPTPYPVALFNRTAAVLVVWVVAFVVARHVRDAAALASTAARLHAAQTAARLGIHELELDSGEARWDARMRELWGVAPGEPVTGETFVQGVHPDDRPRVQAALRRALDAEGAGSLSVEFRVVGTSIPADRWVSENAAVVLEDGRAVRLIGTVQEITERKRAERALEEKEARMRLGLQATGAATWIIDYARGGVEVFDQRSCAIAGLDPHRSEWPAGTFCNLLHPEDRAHMQSASTQTHAEGHGPLVEYRIVRPDGAVRWLQGAGAVQRDATGRPREFVGVSIDITERKRAEEHKELLVRELNHRVKNVLTLVGSLASQTRRSSVTMDQYLETFTERLGALACAHDLLTREGWVGASLKEIAEAIVGAHVRGPQSGTVRIEGPTVRLSANAAVSMSMLVHELCTNAAKYGALSTATGSVSLTWAIRDDAERGWCIDVRWVERGGPPVQAPAHQGFGSRLMERAMRELDGEGEMRFAPEGVEVDLVWPLAVRA